MARPIEFDTSAARESAMVLFWRKGYLASSLPDLLDEMGISRGSFYAAFADKRSLFGFVLALYDLTQTGIHSGCGNECRAAVIIDHLGVDLADAAENIQAWTLGRSKNLLAHTSMTV